MAREISLQEIEQQAQRALQDRMAAVRGLIESREVMLDARAALQDAEQDVSRKYADALSSGWTEADLRGFGLADVAPSGDRPVKRAPRVRAKRATTEAPAE